MAVGGAASSPIYADVLCIESLIEPSKDQGLDCFRWSTFGLLNLGSDIDFIVGDRDAGDAMCILTACIY